MLQVSQQTVEGATWQQQFHPQHLSCDQQWFYATSKRQFWMTSSCWPFSSYHCTAHQSCSVVILCAHFASFRLLFSTCEVTAAFHVSLCSLAKVLVRTRKLCQAEIARDLCIWSLTLDLLNLTASTHVQREILVDEAFQKVQIIAESTQRWEKGRHQGLKLSQCHPKNLCLWYWTISFLQTSHSLSRS